MSQSFVERRILDIRTEASRILLSTQLLAAMAVLGGCSSAQSAHHLDAGDAAADATVQADGGAHEPVGGFTINLVAPTDTDPSGHTSLVGKVYDGPTPAQIIWEPASAAGACRLSTPRVPFCSQACGGSAVCVEDDVCQSYPTARSAGTVHVSGVKTTSGANEFSMEPVAKTYQAPAGVQLPFPAFAEGDAIRIEAKGGDFPAFSLAARGVSPLELSDSPLELQRGSALQVAWTSATASDVSLIHVKLDISHHGGSKGMIECDAADSGALAVSSELITALLDLGVAGYPTIIVTRQNEGSRATAVGVVKLMVVSVVEKAVSVAGLTSCASDTQCPSGQRCQSDLSCK